MPKPKTTEEAYDYGIAEGYLRELSEVNADKIRSLLENAEIIENSAKLLSKTLDRKAREWMSVYSLSYDSLRILSEALLLSDKLDATNHQSLFAALVMRFPGLELSWEFLERVRTKRNGLDYYGNRVSYDDWKGIELQMGLYILTLKKEIRERIS